MRALFRRKLGMVQNGTAYGHRPNAPLAMRIGAADGKNQAPCPE